MKTAMLSLLFGTITLLASTTASARVHVNVDINPFGWSNYPPPVIYQPDPYYAPPPVVYYGREDWGRNHWHDGEHDDGRRGEHRGRHRHP